MTYEEMERTMQFILEQQAQFAVNMAKAEERMGRHEERMSESDERLSRIEGIQENTARQIEHLGNALVTLTEAHERTREELVESQAQMKRALKELAESQAHSDRRLDALIDIVQRGRETGQEPPT
jgi:chromosome segregation ATPase